MGLDDEPSKYMGKAAGAFYIKVSNDGANFSNNESLIIIYDSKCMECTKNGTRTCKVKVRELVFKFSVREKSFMSNCYVDVSRLPSY